MGRGIFELFFAFALAAYTAATQISPNIFYQVQVEDAISRTYIDFSLKARHAQYSLSAAQIYSQILALEFKESTITAQSAEKRLSRKRRNQEKKQRSEEIDQAVQARMPKPNKRKRQHATEDVPQLEMQNLQDKDFELEQLNDDDDFEMNDVAYLETELQYDLEEAPFTLFAAKDHHGFGNTDEEKKINGKQFELTAVASHQLYYATKLKFYQTVLKARDVQAMFWMDRYVQLQVLASGAGANPQVLQFLYLKMYRTNLETMKLSLTFQYLSHFVSWLEDELDVNSNLFEYTGDKYQKTIQSDQGDDLIRDKIYAFTSYHSAASLELQTFFIDLYLLAFMSPTAATEASATRPTTSSFIQEELVEQAAPSSSSSQFFSPSNPQSQMLFLTYFKYYYLIIHYSGARAALTSVFAEKLAYERNNNIAHRDTMTPEKAQEYRKFAQQMFAGQFATCLHTEATINYMLSFWELILKFSPQQVQPQAQQQQQ